MTDFNPYREWLGYSGDGAPSNFYEMLGLTPLESDRDIISSAINERTNRVRKVRPGKYLEQWQRLLDELGSIRELFLDAGRKQQYDLQLSRQSTKADSDSGDTTPDKNRTPNVIPTGANPLLPRVRPMPPAAPNAGHPVPLATPLTPAPPPRQPQDSAQTVPIDNRPPTGIATGTAAGSVAVANLVAPPISNTDPISTAPISTVEQSRTSHATERRKRVRRKRALIGVIAAIWLVPIVCIAIYVARNSNEDRSSQYYANADQSPEKNQEPRQQAPTAPPVRPVEDRTQTEQPPNFQIRPEADPSEPLPESPVVDDGPLVIDRPSRPGRDSLQPVQPGTSNVPEPNVPEPDVPRADTGDPIVLTPDDDESVDDEPPELPRELTPTEIAIMKKALQAAREAMGDRDFDEAEVQINIAAGIALTATQQANVTRMELLHHYVRQFWHAVGECMKGLKGQEQLTINKIIVRVVESSADTITIRGGGKNLTYHKMDLPAGLATVLAARWLDRSDPVSKVIRGAYLAVEPKTDPASARKYWRAAALAGNQDAGDLIGILDGTDAKIASVDPNAPRTRTPSGEPLANDIAGMIKALADAKAAMGQRNLEFSKGRLERAARIATSPEHKSLVERMTTLHHYVEQFWGAVADSLKDFDEVDELMVNGTRIAVVEASAKEITIRVAGRNRTYRRMRIPTGLAIAIADHWLDETDTTSKLIKAAVLIVDPDAKPESAIRLLQEAEVAGADVDELRQVIDDRLDPADLPKARAVAEQGPLPSAQDIIAATRMVKKNFFDDYRGAKTREARYQLAKKLMDEGTASQTDEAYRCALFKEAHNVAVAAHLPKILMQIIDETVRWFAIDEIATKSEALIKTSVRTSGTTARGITFEILQLIDKAMDADRTDVAVRLARVAIGTARSSRDKELMKRASSKSEEVHSLAKEKRRQKSEGSPDR